MTTLWQLVAIPVMVAGILVVTILWWTVSLMSEGYHLVTALIRSAN